MKEKKKYEKPVLKKEGTLKEKTQGGFQMGAAFDFGCS